VLELIEWRFNVAPLTSRDASDEIGNLASALNFASPNLTPPTLPVVRAPIPTPCGLFELGSTIDNESYDFLKLFESDLMAGWKKL
jgi:phospholipase C